MLRRSNDTVFQLSLTELAFVLTFVVLLLIGSKFLLVDRDKATCQKEKAACYAQIPAVLGDPKAAITSLENAPKLRAENEQLRKALASKEAELKALDKLAKNFPDAKRTARAVEFLKGYESATKKDLQDDLADQEGRKAATLQKDLENCRGQLKHCVTVTGATKGYGLPPCWSNDAGGIEYLFEAEIRADGIKLSKAWPSSRNDDADALRAQSVIDRGVLGLPAFKEATQHIFNASKSSNPECRHYVILKRESSLRDIERFNSTRLGVEDYFYKLDKTGSSVR